MGSAAELERRRRRAVELVRSGESPTLIARILGVRRGSIYRWVDLARTARGLTASPHRGPRPRLTPAQFSLLKKLLKRGASRYGWSSDRWTARRVTEVVRRRFGVRYHVEHMRHIMRRI
jgi:transposase